MPGRILWLRKKRPAGSPVEVVEIPEVKVTKTEKPVLKDTSSSLTVNSNPATGAKLHVVKPGETLYSISKTYNVPADTLRKWNRLPDNNLKPGQELIVEPAWTVNVVHKVVAGETMYRISKMYGISVADIMLLNGKKNESLEAGEELIIKRK
jgi:membrane-bound lytic murein transglycosylase D